MFKRELKKRKKMTAKNKLDYFEFAIKKTKLPKDELSTYALWGEVHLNWTFTRRKDETVFFVYDPSSNDKIGTVILYKNGKSKIIVDDNKDWDAKSTRPQPKSTYQATKNTSYRSGAYLSGTKKKITDEEKVDTLTRVVNSYKNGSLALKYGGGKKWHGYYLDVQDLVWGRNLVDGWKINVYYPDRDGTHYGTIDIDGNLGEANIQVDDYKRTIRL